MNAAKLKESVEKNVCFTFSRSGGHGGQNVNKVNTKVHAILPLAKIEGITSEELELMRTRLRNSINSCDNLFVNVQEERFQNVNRERSVLKMEEMIIQSVKQDKVRKNTKIPKSEREKRMSDKKRRSEVKSLRQENFYF